MDPMSPDDAAEDAYWREFDRLFEAEQERERQDVLRVEREIDALMSATPGDVRF